MLFKEIHNEAKQGMREHMLREKAIHMEALRRLGKIQGRGHERVHKQDNSQQTKNES